MPSRNWSVRRDSAAAPQALVRPVPAIRVRFASNAASSSLAPAARAASKKPKSLRGALSRPAIRIIVLEALG